MRNRRGLKIPKQQKLSIGKPGGEGRLARAQRAKGRMVGSRRLYGSSHPGSCNSSSQEVGLYPGGCRKTLKDC